MSLKTICYVSSAKQNLSIIDQQFIFDQTLKKNTSLDISGVLVFNEGNFMQIIEGENDKISILYDKIKEDSRHHNIIEIINNPVKEKLFEGFETGYAVINNLKGLYSLQVYLNLLNQSNIRKSHLKLVSNIIKKFLSVNI